MIAKNRQEELYYELRALEDAFKAELSRLRAARLAALDVRQGGAGKSWASTRADIKLQFWGRTKKPWGRFRMSEGRERPSNELPRELWTEGSPRDGQVPVYSRSLLMPGDSFAYMGADYILIRRGIARGNGWVVGSTFFYGVLANA